MATQNKRDGLKIRMQIHEKRLTHRFVIEILFINKGQDITELAFSNLKRKAELIGLQIRDETGKYIDPEPGLVIRPKKRTCIFTESCPVTLGFTSDMGKDAWGV